MSHSRTTFNENRAHASGLVQHDTSVSWQLPSDPEWSEFNPWTVFFEENPEAVALIKSDDRVVRVNKGFTRMFGYRLEEVGNRSINDLIAPEGQIETSKEYRRRLQDGERVEVETIRRRKDGSEVYVSLLAVPFRTPLGEHFVTYAIYRDISARKRADEQLRESEARFQVMADTAPVMIWMTGTDAICNYFNKPWLDFTGRTMEQEIGTGWIEGVHPDDVQGCFDGFLPNFHARTPFRMEFRLKRFDGEYRWVIESGIPRYTSGGEFAGYIGSNIDITDRKRAEEERERLHQLEADLARINRVSMMGELAASLAHEIKQPVTAALLNAKTCTQWLNREKPNLTEACNAASRMVANTEQTAQIIERVRSLYSRNSWKRELLDVNDIIREMTILLQEKAIRSAVSIRNALAPYLPQIMADRVQLQQVLINLMLNGIEAMKDTGGELTIISTRNPDRQLLISVSDSGIGITPEQTDKIFDAFYTTKPQGTGMGLSISRRIIESHGGRVWVNANSVRGTTFEFTLPFHAAVASPS